MKTIETLSVGDYLLMEGTDIWFIIKDQTPTLWKIECDKNKFHQTKIYKKDLREVGGTTMFEIPGDEKLKDFLDEKEKELEYHELCNKIEDVWCNSTKELSLEDLKEIYKILTK